MIINTRRCIVCKRHNDTVYFHKDEDSGALWCFCRGKCNRGYSLYQYCAAGGISVADFLKNKIDFKEAVPNQVTRMEWPGNFIPLSDPRAEPGVKYLLEERGLQPGDGMYYDTDRKGIVFPYFFGDIFVGAQIRFIKPWEDKEGHLRKIDTLPGTRLGLVLYNFNQGNLMANIKGMIVVEGAFDVQALQQAFYAAYGNVLSCPWRVVACSGSGATKHQLEVMRDMVKKGYTVVIAPDSDEAGLNMGRKFTDAGAATHVAYTEDASIDWNDKAKLVNNPKQYIQWFMGKVNHV